MGHERQILQKVFPKPKNMTRLSPIQRACDSEKWRIKHPFQIHLMLSTYGNLQMW